LRKVKAKKSSISTISATELSELCVSLIQDKKGSSIVSLDLSNIPEAITDYFVVCHANSTIQVRAILDYIDEEVKNRVGVKPIHVEGRSNAEWCLIDFGDVIVHVFLKEKREFYQLEDLWSDATAKMYD